MEGTVNTRERIIPSNKGLTMEYLMPSNHATGDITVKVHNFIFCSRKLLWYCCTESDHQISSKIQQNSLWARSSAIHERERFIQTNVLSLAYFSYFV